jgi:hypothetical protein
VSGRRCQHRRPASIGAEAMPFKVFVTSGGYRGRALAPATNRIFDSRANPYLATFGVW